MERYTTATVASTTLVTVRIVNLFLFPEQCSWIDYVIYQDYSSLLMTHTMCQVTPHLTSKHTQGGTDEKKKDSKSVSWNFWHLCTWSIWQWGCPVVTRFHLATQSQGGDMFSWFVTTCTIMTIDYILKYIFHSLIVSWVSVLYCSSCMVLLARFDSCEFLVVPWLYSWTR